MQPARLERRAATELRAAGRKLEGYAAVFGAPAQIGPFTETVIAGAFRASLADAANDPVMLVDHDVGKMLGRRSAGTLRLAEDAHGLAFSCDVPPTTVGNDLLAMVERGDCRSCSFSFRAIDETWPAPDQRQLRAVTLYEVSAIHVAGAYAETSIQARARVDQVPPFVLRRRRLLALHK